MNRYYCRFIGETFSFDRLNVGVDLEGNRYPRSLGVRDYAAHFLPVLGIDCFDHNADIDIMAGEVEDQRANVGRPEQSESG